MFRIITILLAGLAPMPCNAEFRDPTQPAYPLPSTAAPNTANVNGLVLSAIWISSQSRRATINGVSAKQGQTLVIEPTSSLNPEPASPANTAITGDKKDELLNKTMEYANAGTNRPSQENIIVPPHAATSESDNLARLRGQSTMNSATSSIALPPASMQSSKTAPIPARSTTIKIISIHKNSVTINQNGELKTLQLVQRPYKTQ